MLLLPLVGGYFFANTCNATRFRAAREEGHRLYFRAAFYGVILFAVALLLRVLVLIAWPGYRAWEHSALVAIQPILKQGNEDAAIVVLLSLIALAIGVLAGPVVNRLIIGKSFWLKAAIKEDEFEALLHRAVARAMPVSLTMENGKVYVGFVSKTFEPKMSRKNFRILPLMSGYRSDAGKVNFTTYYDKAYERVGLGANDARLSLRDFEIVLPTDKVHSAGLFDVRAYQEFQTLAGAGIAPTDLERDRKAWNRSDRRRLLNIRR